MVFDFMFGLQPIVHLPPRFATPGFVDFIRPFLDQVLQTSSGIANGIGTEFDAQFYGRKSARVRFGVHNDSLLKFFLPALIQVLQTIRVNRERVFDEVVHRRLKRKAITTCPPKSSLLISRIDGFADQSIPGMEAAV